MYAESVEQLWQKTLAAALLGTDRQPFVPPQVEGALGEAFAHLNSADSEGALLSMAAVLGSLRRIGMIPVPFGRSLPPPCPPDPLPPTSARAGELLALISPRQPNLIEEWLQLAFKHRQRAREEDIPQLLTLTEKYNSALGALVAGVRGRWLAALVGKGWRFAAFQLEDDSAWRTGERITRRTFFGALRLTDPERARTVLESTWEREEPNARADFVETFLWGLSAADLPFLIRVADSDRVLSVRRAAESLIARLTDPPPPPDQCEANALPLFALERTWRTKHYELIAACHHAWSAAFSAQFAAYLPRLLAMGIAPNQLTWTDASFPIRLEGMLMCVHPSAIEAVKAHLEVVTKKGGVLHQNNTWQTMLDLRAKLHAAWTV